MSGRTKDAKTDGAPVERRLGNKNRFGEEMVGLGRGGRLEQKIRERGLRPVGRELCVQGGWCEAQTTPALPAARGPAVPGSHWHIPGHSAGLEAAHQGPLLGGRLLPIPPGNMLALGSFGSSQSPKSLQFLPTMFCPKAASLPQTSASPPGCLPCKPEAYLRLHGDLDWLWQ